MKAELPQPTGQESHGAIHQLLCALGLSYLPSGMPTFGNGQRPGILQEERALGLRCSHSLHPSFGSSHPSKDFPAFLITPFSAPLFQEARGFFQCPDSPDSWQSFSLQGFLCFLILGVTKLETGKCDPLSPAELGPARLGTS